VVVTGERLARALLSNLDVWIEDIEKISSMPGPHQRQALHLEKSMLQTKLSLSRMIELSRIED
jgi:hypothetical protein